MKRLITGAILIPFFFYVVIFSPLWAFTIVLAAVGLACYFEFLGIAAPPGNGGPELRRWFPPYVAGLVFLLLPSYEGIFLTLATLLIWVLLLREHNLARILPSAAAITFGIVYIFGSWRAALGLRMIDPWWILFALAINWVGDSAAYYTGRAIGKHKLAPSISPAKTWEGTIGSLAATAALGVAFLHWRFPALGMPQAFILCVAGNIAGQVGDLAESAIKRGAGVKDSGNLLPGHGGWLDRVDSSLFSVPVVYWLLQQGWFRP